MLLQDLHDSHVCNSLLVAESEEDIWKNESLYKPRLNTSDGESQHTDTVTNLDQRSPYCVCVNISQTTARRRATRPETTWLPPCSSSLDILPATWCGAQSSTSTPAWRWDPIWECQGVSGRSDLNIYNIYMLAWQVNMQSSLFPAGSTHSLTLICFAFAVNTASTLRYSDDITDL